MPLQPTAPIICGKTTTATHPSAIAIAAASHFGASTHANLRTIAASAPPQIDGEDHGRPGPVEDEQGERGVGAGDQQVDAGMVDAARPAVAALLPGHPVMERAGAEHPDDGEREDVAASRARPSGENATSSEPIAIEAKNA